MNIKNLGYFFWGVISFLGMSFLCIAYATQLSPDIPGLNHSGRTLIIAHRGASGYCLENTLVAFELAVRMGADVIEFDLRKTRDNQLVVIHDQRIDRITKERGEVADKTLSELKSLSIRTCPEEKYENEKILSLEEVLGWARERKIRLLIDVKVPAVEENLLKVIDQYQMSQRCIIACPGDNFLENVRRINPEIMTLRQSTRLGTPADILGIHYQRISSELTRAIHKKHKLVWVWTVNTPGLIKRCLEMEVDGIITNYPDRVVEILAGEY